MSVAAAVLVLAAVVFLAGGILSVLAIRLQTRALEAQLEAQRMLGIWFTEQLEAGREVRKMLMDEHAKFADLLQFTLNPQGWLIRQQVGEEETPTPGSGDPPPPEEEPEGDGDEDPGIID